MWNSRTVQEIKIVVGSFASVSKNLLGELAEKLDITISISLPPKNYATRKGKDFKKSIRGLE